MKIGVAESVDDGARHMIAEYFFDDVHQWTADQLINDAIAIYKQQGIVVKVPQHIVDTIK